MAWWLVRHSRVALPAGMCYGRLEVPLAADFPQAVAWIAQQVPCHADMAYWSSPSLRCRTLAETLAPLRPWQFSSALQELDFGQWEGQRWDDLPTAEACAWGNDFVTTVCPGGESYAQLARRVQQWWARAMRYSAGGLVICHAGVMRALAAHWQGIALVDSFNQPLPYATVLHYQPQTQQLTWHYPPESWS